MLPVDEKNNGQNERKGQIARNVPNWLYKTGTKQITPDWTGLKWMDHAEQIAMYWSHKMDCS